VLIFDGNKNDLYEINICDVDFHERKLPKNLKDEINNIFLIFLNLEKRLEENMIIFLES